MKKLYLLFLFISIANLVEAQEWIKYLPQNKMDKGALTLYDIQKAFYTAYPDNRVTDGKIMVDGEMQKIPGWKQFKRWEWYWESRVNPITGEFPSEAAIEMGLSSVSRAEIKGGGYWTSMGPDASPGGYAGLGRLNCIAFHPTDEDTYWVGSPSGGLWKTTDDGATWEVLTDNNKVLGVSSIIIHPDYANNPTIFIGTGDRDRGSVRSLGGGQGYDNNGVGVLKSTDGGLTWEETGLSYMAKQKRTINKLLMRPDNDQVLLAAMTKGIYKTTDGGTTWQKITPGSDNYIDIEFKPGNPNVVYASTYRWGSSKIYRSIDAGDTWEEVYSDTDLMRIELAVSVDEPDWVYAIAANTSAGLKAIVKSTDSGQSFSATYTGGTDKALLYYTCSGSGQNRGHGWYDLCISVDPNDANTIYIGGINTWKSTDGGVSWSISTHWAGTCGGNATTVHADQHALEFRLGTSVLFCCNDGGVYKTTNGGQDWHFKGSGLSISQLYRIGVSQTQPNEVICGLQDNGSKLVSNNTWRDVLGGDGMECLIDYTDENIQYACYQNGRLYRTDKHWLSKKSVKPSGAGAGPWVTPYVIDPVDHKTLYAGYADLWRTTAKGNYWSKTDLPTSKNKWRSIAIAPSDHHTLYVSDLDHLWKTSDGGTVWEEITTGLPVVGARITYLAVKYDDSQTLWVTLGGYNSHGVYESTDGGATWTNISAGLPELPIMTIVQNKQNTNEIELYVGTDVGVYKKQGDQMWLPFSNQLPNVLVTELEFYYDDAHPKNTKLRAATFGRGLWESRLNSDVLRSNINITRSLRK